MAGTTTSIDFPVTAGAYQPTYPSPGSTAGFVTELDPIGSALIYSTYFGASAGSTNVTAIALDASHDAYLTGYTNANNFPTTPGAYETSETASGLYAFATELNSTGTGLVYSTYLSGTEATGTHATYGFGIAVDVYDNAYVVGTTTSATYPTTAGSFQPVQGCAYPPNCGGNGFVTKVSAGGASLSYSTYLGTGSNKPLAVALDSSGDAFVVGSTGTTTFPVTPGAFMTSSTDSVAAFVTEINSLGTALIYSTFLSGTNSSIGDEALAVAVDASGYAYVTGLVGDSNFPTTAGAYQTKLLDASDAFVTKLNLTGSALEYSTYLPGHTTGYGIGVNSSGEAYVAGLNYGSAGTFPTTSGAFQASAPATTTNGFLTVFNAAGSGLVYSTYIGVTSGNEITYAYAVAVDSTGNAYVTGAAQPNFPTTPGAYKTTLTANANYPYPVNAFIMKFGFGLSISPTTLATGAAGVSYGPVTFTASGGTGTVTFAVTTGSLPSGLTLSPAGLISGTPTQTGSYPITITATDSEGDTGSENLTLVINCPTITVGPSTLTNGTVGTAYSQLFTATGGVPLYTFSATGLPTGIGMSFTPGGLLSGTPNTAETSLSIAVTATDSNQCAGSVTDTLTINSGSMAPAVVTDNETITVTDTETFPDVADSETITVTDRVTVTPLISITAPVASFSTSSLGFGSVAAGTTGTQTITVSNVGEGQTGLALSGAVISPSGTPFSIGIIACSNGAGSLSTTLPSGGACMVTISYTAPASGTPPSAAVAFTDNASLSNLTSTPSGSSYMQTISLNGTGTTAPQPSEPPASVSVSDNETITVTDTETFPDVADSESITVNDQVSITVSQTITFGPAPTVVVGGSGTLSATASSGLPVTFSSTTPTICSVTGSTVTGLAVGSCIVAANQAGNATYSPAPQLTQTISITPSAGLSPATLTFADQLVGSTSATQTVTLTNAGTAKLTVGTITTTADFTHPSKTCTATLAAGSSCNINVAFAPKAAGALSGTLTVGTNGTVALSGTGFVPSASITPATYTFANQQVDTTSKVQTFTYSNTGLVSITVSSVTLSGAAAANYVIASDPCTGATLFPAATCDVGVTFTPSAANNRVATLTVTDETGGAAKAKASLSGTGVAATASLTGTAAFGNQQVGVTRAAQTLTYQNTGLGAISVNSAALSGNAATDYVTATDACTGATLAASATCSIGVTFTPSAVGSRVASLMVTDSTGGAKAQSLSLSGTGMAPTISLGSGTYAYGAVTVATAATFTLTNSGTAPLVINTIALTTGAQFSVTGGTCTVGGSVSNGGTCTVIVTFTPSGTTKVIDTLTVSGMGLGTGAPTYTASRAMTGH